MLNVVRSLLQVSVILTLALLNTLLWGLLFVLLAPFKLLLKGRPAEMIVTGWLYALAWHYMHWIDAIFRLAGLRDIDVRGAEGLSEDH